MVVLVASVALSWQRELAGLECFCVDEVCDIPARGKRLATKPLGSVRKVVGIRSGIISEKLIIACYATSSIG